MALIAQHNHLGTWPRRLLHVPSLTCHEWRPGNLYGDTFCPVYNIVTYTCGMFKLSPYDVPHVPSLRVHNIPWAIPRIHPEYFTVDNLLAVLQQARGWRLSYEGFLVPETDWVWIDMACVDQRKGSPDAHAETGRQRDIFAGATRVFAWLTSTRSRDLDAFYMSLRKLDAFRSPQVLDQVYDTLRQVLTDPYFTSVWTLSETALRPDTILLSHGAKLTPLQSPHPPSYSQALSIRHLTDLSLRLRSLNVTTPSALKMHNLLEFSGINAIATSNPMAVYISARNRRCIRPKDRFYGIQSIFNLRIGNTAPGFAGTHWSTNDLSIQLVEEMIALHPALSQMFIHIAPTFTGTSWGINNLSIFPQIPPRFCVSFRKSRPSCALSRLDIRGVTWGWIQGYVCHFTTFYNRCMDNEMRLYGAGASFAAYLDATSEMADCPEERNTADPVKQRRLLRWLKQSFEDRLVVMEMQSVGEVSFGLVLLRKPGRDFAYYRRLGICFWEGQGRSMREVYPREWVYRKGFLG